MKTQTSTSQTIDVENLHQLFANSPSVQNLLKKSDKLLANLQLPPRKQKEA